MIHEKLNYVTLSKNNTKFVLNNIWQKNHSHKIFPKGAYIITQDHNNVEELYKVIWHHCYNGLLVRELFSNTLKSIKLLNLKKLTIFTLNKKHGEELQRVTKPYNFIIMHFDKN